jgi:hypothetical protein
MNLMQLVGVRKKTKVIGRVLIPVDAFDETHELFTLCETLLKGPKRKADKPFKDKTGKMCSVIHIVSIKLVNFCRPQQYQS